METCFADTPKVKGSPMSKRVGDNLLERDDGGHVTCCVGYFGKGQAFARGLFVKAITLELKKKGFGCARRQICLGSI